MTSSSVMCLLTRWRRPAFGLLVVALSTTSVLGVASTADRSAMDWIQSMSFAMQESNYRGRFVYMHENRLESMSISHMKDESGEKERLFSLNGEARIVIRDDKNFTCIWPSSREVVVASSRKNPYSPLFIPSDIERIGKLYDLNLLGSDRVADSLAVVIEIKPRDGFRYGLKFWISVDNSLMLKSNLIDEHNKVVEQVMFTSLDLLTEGQPLDKNSMPSIDANYTMIRHKDGRKSTSVDKAPWQLHEVPVGFWQESIMARHDPATGEVVHQLLYTDGLASLSIFIEKSTRLQQTQTSMGAVNAFIRMVDGYSITAIGEVPAKMVQHMAESVFYQKFQMTEHKIDSTNGAITTR